MSRGSGKVKTLGALIEARLTVQLVSRCANYNQITCLTVLDPVPTEQKNEQYPAPCTDSSRIINAVVHSWLWILEWL